MNLKELLNEISWHWDKQNGKRLFWDFYAMYFLWSWIGSGIEEYFGKSPDIYEPYAKGAQRITSPYDVFGKVPYKKIQELIDGLFYKVLKQTAEALIWYLKRACVLELQHIGQSNLPSFASNVASKLTGTNAKWEVFVAECKKQFPGADPEFILRYIGFYHYYSSNAPVYTKLLQLQKKYYDEKQKELNIKGWKQKSLEKWLSQPVNDKELFDIENQPPPPIETPTSATDIPDYPHGEPESVPTPFKKDPTYTSHDVYWNPNPTTYSVHEPEQSDADKKAGKKPSTSINVHKKDKSKLFESEDVESSSGMKKFKKILEAMKKSGMTMRDVQYAYFNNTWNEYGAYGASAWGEGMQAAFELEDLVRSEMWSNKTMKDIAWQIDRIYDLNHNTGNLLNKSAYIRISDKELDQRAKMTSVVRMIPYVSPLIARLIKRFLPYLGLKEDDLTVDEKINEPTNPFTPEQETTLKGIGFTPTTVGTAKGSYNWSKEKRAGLKKHIKNYTTPLIIKQHKDGVWTFHDEMMTDLKKFNDFDSLVKYVSEIYGKQMNASGVTSSSSSSSYSAPVTKLSKYISEHTLIKLSPDKEQKLAAIHFGWRPSSSRYRAEAIDGNNFYFYAFSDNSFVLVRKSTPDIISVFYDFNKAVEVAESLSNGNVNPLPQTIQGKIGKPTAAAGTTQKVAPSSHPAFAPVVNPVSNNTIKLAGNLPTPLKKIKHTPGPAPAVGYKAGIAFEARINKAGFTWDETGKKYVDNNKGHILIIHQDRSSDLTFSNGEGSKFKNLLELLTYLEKDYPKDSAEKIAKSGSNSDESKELTDLEIEWLTVNGSTIFPGVKIEITKALNNVNVVAFKVNNGLQFWVGKDSGTNEPNPYYIGHSYDNTGSYAYEIKRFSDFDDIQDYIKHNKDVLLSSSKLPDENYSIDNETIKILNHYGFKDATPTTSGLGTTFTNEEIGSKVIIWFDGKVSYNINGDTEGYNSFDEFNKKVLQSGPYVYKTKYGPYLPSAPTKNKNSLLNKKLPQSVQLLNVPHNKKLKEYGFNWYSGVNYYYNDKLNQAIVFKGQFHSSKSPIELYTVHNDGLFSVKTFHNISDLFKELEKSSGQSSEHNYDTVKEDGLLKMIKLIPDDAEKIKSIGFNLDESHGYPLYVNNDGNSISISNDDTLYFNDAEQLEQTAFQPDGTVSGWSNKGAPYHFAKGGVKNGIANIIKYYNDKGGGSSGGGTTPTSPQPDNPSDLAKKLRSYMKKSLGL